MPVLETPTGGVWESNAIARYVARLADTGLFGSTAFETVLYFSEYDKGLTVSGYGNKSRACYM